MFCGSIIHITVLMQSKKLTKSFVCKMDLNFRETLFSLHSFYPYFIIVRQSRGSVKFSFKEI